MPRGVDLGVDLLLAEIGDEEPDLSSVTPPIAAMQGRIRCQDAGDVL